MLLHHSQPPRQSLDDRVVYPHTASQVPQYGGIAWDCYSNNNNNNNNKSNNNSNAIHCVNDTNITTLDYYCHNNAGNNIHNSYNNNNNDNNDYPTRIVNLDHRNPSTAVTHQSDYQFNIPIFLTPIKEEITEQASYRHQQHQQQQQQQQQQRQHQQRKPYYTPLPQFSSLHTAANYATMPRTTAKQRRAALTAITKPPSLSKHATLLTHSPPSTSPPTSTSMLPSSSPSSTMTFSTSHSSSSSPSSSSSFFPSTSSSLSSSPSPSTSSPSTSPLSSSMFSSSSSSSSLKSTPSSFTENSYSTSEDKLYLVNNFPHDSISTTPSNSDSQSSISAKGSLNMINMISSYNAETQLTLFDTKDTLIDLDDNSHLWEPLDSSLSPHRPLPDIWTTFGHPSPKHIPSCLSSFIGDLTCNDVVTSATLDDNFGALQDLQLLVPFENEMDMNLFNYQSTHVIESSEEDEDGSHNMSDCGYSSDPTTPISNESSSDWSGPFNNELPVFEELQSVSNPEEEKRPRKRSTPSPHQKRKSTDSSNPNEKERKKPGRKPGQVSNVLHLWEFMRDLLLDPSISDGIIQWVSKSEGVFRVVDSSEVARLWGQKKNNKKEMTYEKLSRSLRYSRLEGYFDNLPKDKNYPKKLCFKFGPKSRHFSSLGGSAASQVTVER